MRATQNEQVVTLFGGDYVTQGFRGRRSAPQLSPQASRRLAVVVGALLLGFATAATAVTVRRHQVATDGFSQSTPANLMVAPGSSGFEAALY
jgi:hypothetical protein